MTGAKADNDCLTLRISAIAQSMIKTDTGPVDCGSTGRLERTIFSAVTVRLSFH